MLLALVVLGIGGIWTLFLAFSRSILWGLAVLLVPFASLFFLIAAWDDAKRPFFLKLFAGGLFGAAFMLLPVEMRSQEALQKWAATQGASGARPTLEKPAPSTLPPPSLPSAPAVLPSAPAVPLPPVEEQLQRLAARETVLKTRKAALKKGDRAGAEAVSRDIVQYNAELKAVMERKKAMEPAAKK